MTETPRIRYEVRAPRPSDHRIVVTMVVGGEPGTPFEVVFPSWIPGSYWIQDRVRNVSGMTARAAGHPDPLPVRRTEKARWRVEPGPHRAAEVEYTMYGNELRSGGLDVTDEHLFLSTGFALPYVEGRRSEPLEVSLTVPPEWTVHTELPEVGRHPPTYRAADYDELVDHPFDAGRAPSFPIQPLGIPHRLVVCGSGGNYEPHRLPADVGRIVEASIRLFGESPVPSYTFFYHLTSGVTAGLEHARSSHCLVDRTAFRVPSRYRAVLSLTAHEYLHLYNVKRIHPKAFDPFDYTRETYTRLLWAMEGTTDYLTWLVLRRAELTSPDRALSDLAEKIRRYRDLPGRLHQSLEEASLAAWVDFYHWEEETPNRSISYYLKGDLVSLCLDLELRSRTANASSLETVWRELWNSYGRTRRGLGETELPEVIERVTGVDARGFFGDHVAGTKEVDFERFLGLAGVALRSRPVPRRPDDDPVPGYLGVEVENSAGRVQITTVRDGGPGRAAGLSPGDEVVAVDGNRVRFDDWANALGRYLPGSPLELTVFRRARLTAVPVVVGEAPPKELAIVPLPDAPPAARALYASWVGAPWTPPKPVTPDGG
ncbi:MAG: PDZ domain-containing protein [Thermoplasmata archaeon]|nr:PDZ domain-containing protein [Thermoplasmata archaeon]